jgi:hypothetical protein
MQQDILAKQPALLVLDENMLHGAKTVSYHTLKLFSDSRAAPYARQSGKAVSCWLMLVDGAQALGRAATAAATAEVAFGGCGLGDMRVHKSRLQKEVEAASAFAQPRRMPCPPKARCG